jgi:transposase
VITVVMYAKIRRMHFREHLTISEIQRRTSLSCNTIKKWLRGSEAPHQQRRNRNSKLTPFEPLHKLALETGKTHLATALGVAGIQHHGKRVRFYSTVDLANTLEQEKAAGKQGKLALSLM